MKKITTFAFDKLISKEIPMNRHFFLILTFFICSVSFLSAKEVRVFGYVYTPEREGATGAVVQAVDKNAATAALHDGYYELRFTVDENDTATVRYTYLGCDTVDVKIHGKQSNVQKFVYLKYRTYQTRDAVVSATATQTGQMSDLNIDHLRLLSSSSGDAISSLLKFQGASSTNEMSSQYSVRGGSYDENSVYVNNIEVYRPLLIRSGQQEGLSFINADMVSAVRFSAGGFDAEYGDKMSSTLDITYKKPTEFEASITGSLLGASAYLGHATKNGRFTQLHGFRYKTSDYLFNTLDTKGVYDQRFIDYQTYLTFLISPKWGIDFLGNFSQNSYLSIPKSQETTFGTMYTQRTLKVAF
ncbi:MAG: Plug domain-containing protein, partial [Prevotellaceae bacterium]|nr:Plug domain-containing protein [Prevotellaceae bacterium]